MSVSEPARMGATGARRQAAVAPDLTVSYLAGVPVPVAGGSPLVIAIPGGGYTAQYFDIPGCSLLHRAALLGIEVLALDRPGYAGTTALAPARATLAANAEQLERAVAFLWQSHAAAGCPGVVLIGHSIGAAIAVLMAARRRAWPLLGIALSGVGLTPPPQVTAGWSSLPPLDYVSIPPEAKDAFMFGPPWTFEPTAPGRSRTADSATPRAELIDIVSGWPAAFAAQASQVSVPVHYRQAEFDRLWVVDEVEVARFGAGFSRSPSVDARLYAASGHCIDFHHVGPALQLEQLAFALRCAVVRR